MQTDQWKKVSEILVDCLEIEVSDRERYLNRLELRPEIRTEIDSLLSLEEEADKLMNLSAVELSTGYFQDDTKEPTMAGQVFGAYRVVREIGSGGMGLATRDGTPKLLDLGISKILSDEIQLADSATITKLGVMTPSYASPEQIQSKSVTTATDIYSLGVILYELLSGHRQFETKEHDLKEIYQAIVENDPPLPSSMVETASKHFKTDTEAKTQIQSIEEPKYRESLEKLEEINKDGNLGELDKPKLAEIKGYIADIEGKS